MHIAPLGFANVLNCTTHTHYTAATWWSQFNQQLNRLSMDISFFFSLSMKHQLLKSLGDLWKDYPFLKKKTTVKTKNTANTTRTDSKMMDRVWSPLLDPTSEEISYFYFHITHTTYTFPNNIDVQYCMLDCNTILQQTIHCILIEYCHAGYKMLEYTLSHVNSLSNICLFIRGDVVCSNLLFPI